METDPDALTGSRPADEVLRQAIGASLDALLAALDLQPVDTDRFLARAGSRQFERLFGGQLLAQALVAAGATVPDQAPESLHAASSTAGRNASGTSRPPRTSGSSLRWLRTLPGSSTRSAPSPRPVRSPSTWTWSATTGSTTGSNTLLRSTKIVSLGGLPQQAYCDGIHEISDDETLIIETDLPWGIIQLRWNRASDHPDPTMRKVPLAEVRRHLPDDTPVVSAEERDRLLALRRQGAQYRRIW